MLKRFLRWLSTPTPPRVEVLPAVVRPASFFTSDLEGKGRTRAELLEAVQRHALPVPSYQLVAQDGAALDSSGDSWSTGAKAAFQMSGGNMPDAQLLWYAGQGFIGFQLCAILAQQWLIDKACTTPARDAMRNGYKVTLNTGQAVDAAAILAKLERADKKYKIKAQAVELIRMARIFGIRIAVFKVESADPKYYERPFNPDGITPGSYKGIVQIDPYWCTPELSPAGVNDPTSPEFYEPTHWVIQGKRYHKSHLVIARGPDVPDVLKPSYQYAGMSLPQRIYERVYAAERTANEGPQLALTKRAMIFYTDTGKALADEEKFNERLLTWTRLRDNHGVKVADKDGDKIEQVDTALTGFSETVMDQYQLVAAIANVPATKLLGTTPKGFNSSGGYEESSYHEELESIQAGEAQPLIERHNLCVMRSEIAPTLGINPVALTIEWNPTDAPTAKEEAEVQKLKAETDNVLVTAGAIDGTDIRQRIAKDPASGYDGIDVTDVPAPPAPMPGGFGAGQDAGFYGRALDSADWDPVSGEYAEAELLTNQDYLNHDKIAEKIAHGDFTVQLSPEFQTAAGKRYRVIIDGHHSLQAAVESGNLPVFVEADYGASDYRNAMTKLPMAGVERSEEIAG